MIRKTLNRLLKRVFIPIFVLAVSVEAPLRAFADSSWPSGCYVEAEGACLMDGDSMTVLYSKNGDTPYYPASITKVLTALLTIENCSLDETVTFSEEAVAYEEDNSTIIGASAGDRLSVRDCLYSLLFHSANDVANALAEHVGGSREAFVAMMNEKAAELGCTGSHFNNPSGLTDPDHYTTAHDMALIMAEAVKDPVFREIQSNLYYTHAPIKRYPDPNDPWNTVYAKHKMLKRNSFYYYPGVFAGKTGFTTTAGNTLVTACEKDGMTLIAVILNGHLTQYEDTTRMLDFGYNNFKSLYVSENDEKYSSVTNDMTVMGLPLLNTVDINLDEGSKVTIPKSADFSELSSGLSFDLGDRDPEGAIAKIQYSYGDRAVGTAYLSSSITGLSTQLEALSDDPLLSSEPETEASVNAVSSGGEAAYSPAAATQAEYAGEASLSNEAETPSIEVNEALQGAEEKNFSPLSFISSLWSEDRVILGITVPAFVVRIFLIAAAALALVLIIGFILLQNEKKEARARARRRAQRLHHTKDLTRKQSMDMDMMIQNKMFEKPGRRGRRK